MTHDEPRYQTMQLAVSFRTTVRRLVNGLLLAVILLVLGVGTSLLIDHRAGPRERDQPVNWSDAPTVERIQSLSQLVTTRVTISDVLTGESDDVRGVWLIKGDALLGIDLSDAKVLSLDPLKRHAVISLKQPVVLSARVDHERSMTWDVQRTTWTPWKGDKDRLRDKAMYHAQKLVEFAASRPELIEEARSHAAHAIYDTYRSVDWNVEIRWR